MFTSVLPIFKEFRIGNYNEIKKKKKMLTFQLKNIHIYFHINYKIVQGSLSHAFHIHALQISEWFYNFYSIWKLKAKTLSMGITYYMIFNLLKSDGRKETFFKNNNESNEYVIP